MPVAPVTHLYLRNPFPLTTSCQVPHNHVIAFYNLSPWLSNKVNGETSREVASFYPLPLLISGGWLNKVHAKIKQNFQTQSGRGKSI